MLMSECARASKLFVSYKDDIEPYPLLCNKEIPGTIIRKKHSHADHAVSLTGD